MAAVHTRRPSAGPGCGVRPASRFAHTTGTKGRSSARGAPDHARGRSRRLTITLPVGRVARADEASPRDHGRESAGAGFHTRETTMSNMPINLATAAVLTLGILPGGRPDSPSPGMLRIGTRPRRRPRGRRWKRSSRSGIPATTRTCGRRCTFPSRRCRAAGRWSSTPSRRNSRPASTRYIVTRQDDRWAIQLRTPAAEPADLDGAEPRATCHEAETHSAAV